MVRILLCVAAFLLPFAASGQDYRIQIGDRLQVSVLEDANLNRTVLVRPDGQISLPLAGTVRAAGQTTTALEGSIRNAISGNFSVTPNVSVSLVGLADRELVLPQEEEEILFDVYLMGEVNSPGLVQVKPGTTVLQALAQGGGLSPFAASKRIQIRRIDPATRQETVRLFNFDAVERGAAISTSFQVQTGDVILVPERGLFE